LRLAPERRDFARRADKVSADFAAPGAALTMQENADTCTPPSNGAKVR
jgi:hypothetical protein